MNGFPCGPKYRRLRSRRWLAVAVSIAATIGAYSSAHAQSQFTITVLGKGLGKGRIDSGPIGTPAMNCTIQEGIGSGTCTASYTAGAVVTVVAWPAENVSFVGWSGAACGGGGQDCVLPMNQNYTITADFFPTKSFTLSVTVNGNGYGTVRQLDLRGSPKFNCSIQGTGVPVTCTSSYPATTTAWLEKTPGIQFASSGAFSGACSGDPCRFAMDGDRSVTATFTSPAVTVGTSGGTGAGRVTANGGIDCAVGPTGASGSCSATYPSPSQQTVTLTAAANPGSKFAGWNVSDRTCEGTGACVVNAPAYGLPGTVVSARFDVDQSTITINGTGSGSIKSTPNGIDCKLTVNVPSASCDAPFAPGTSVTLTATPAAGWQFGSWGGSCATATTNVCELQMTQDRPVTVTFTRTLVTLTIAAAGTGDGRIASSSPAGIIDCDVKGTNVTGTCSAQVPFETNVTLTATPAANSTFESWSLASCTGTGSCTVPMTTSQTITAAFRGTRVTVTVGGLGTGDGLVTSTDGMSCRITRGVAAATGCATSGVVGGSVTLTAIPQDGSLFASWSLASCPSTSSTCAVPVNQPTNVSASFTAPPAAAQLVDALLVGPALSALQASELDKFGNKDGTFNLGDLLALLDRTGESVSPAALARMSELERSQSQRPSPRRGAP